MTITSCRSSAKSSIKNSKNCLLEVIQLHFHKFFKTSKAKFRLTCNTAQAYHDKLIDRIGDRKPQKKSQTVFFFMKKSVKTLIYQKISYVCLKFLLNKSFSKKSQKTTERELSVKIKLTKSKVLEQTKKCENSNSSIKIVKLRFPWNDPKFGHLAAKKSLN